MATPAQTEVSKIDIRTYLAIFVFRWKIIVLSILVCLFAAVMYMLLTPNQYLTRTVVMIYRDPNTTLTDSGTQWSSIHMHMWLLNSEELHSTVIKKLEKDWYQKVGGSSKMNVPVSVDLERGHGSVLALGIRNTSPEYAVAYLKAIWEEFMSRQAFRKQEVSGKAVEVLGNELKSLESEIRQAQDDLIDYTRLVAYDVVATQSDMERRYLLTLLARKNALNTELLLLDTEFPMVMDQGAGVIESVRALTEKVGTLPPVSVTQAPAGTGAKGEHAATSMPEKGEKTIFPEFGTADQHLVDTPEVQRWSTMKVELMRLQAQTNALLARFRPDHVEVKAVIKQIEDLQEQLKVSHEVAYGRLKDRRKALKILSEALDAPIRDWNNTFRRASVNESEYRRKSLVVERREGLYRTLYSRLQDLKVAEELKSEHFVVIAPAKTVDSPVWPKASKVMLVAIVAALGGGLGLAVLAHMFDNKMQTIIDVETVLGFPFLGGVPRWTGAGVDKVARPIVLEENASGAVEAYRVLRTNVLSALDKAGQKMVLLTSAESKEGKTITTLNLAVMTAKVGKKVLLVDMDLRRPRLHRSLGCARQPGVTDALTQGIPLQDIVIPTEVENLSLAPSGSEVDNVSELLQAVNLSAFFSGVKQQFDYIFVDTAPVLRAADVSILSSRGLCSIVYVARVNHTPKPLIKYAMDQLSQEQILGVIMNNIDLSRISSLYYSYQYPNYAYYSYSYAHGYNYDNYADGIKSARKKPHQAGSALGNFARGIRRALLPME
ncbi:MAG: polysaccharide biosynthesis tyrosine autokinase [bacterium]